MAPSRLLRFLPPSQHQRPLQILTVAALGAGLSFTLLTPGASQGTPSQDRSSISAEDWQTHVRFNQMDSTP